MILEDRLNDDQKDELRKTMMTNLDKLKNQKDVQKFMSKMKTQIDQLMNDYVALKEFNDSKSNQINEL